jgi:hypothetical protein
VLHYLARYTHRVAISNRRLIAIDDRVVTFKWKDYHTERCTLRNLCNRGGALPGFIIDLPK